MDHTNLISIRDPGPEGLGAIIRSTGEIKAAPGEYESRLKGKILVMIFEKPSTRTRVSFEAGMMQLGGNALTINREGTQLGRGETIADSARVLCRYADGIMARVNLHRSLFEMAANSTVPVISGLSNIEHPCQAISDLFTIYEITGKLKGTNLAYIGDGNNVCNSLILGCAIFGINISVASPEGYGPDKNILNSALAIAKKEKTGSRIIIGNDPAAAVKNAGFIYTDVWISMGDEGGREARLKAFRDYQVNMELLENAKPGCRVMHCLPAHRGEEITDDVLDGPNSIVWDQAENRLHAQKAILLALLGNFEKI